MPWVRPTGSRVIGRLPPHPLPTRRGRAQEIVHKVNSSMSYAATVSTSEAGGASCWRTESSRGGGPSSSSALQDAPRPHQEAVQVGHWPVLMQEEDQVDLGRGLYGGEGGLEDTASDGRRERQAGFPQFFFVARRKRRDGKLGTCTT